MQGSLVSFHGWAPAVVVAIVVAVVVVVAVGRSPFNFELFGATSPLPTSEHREHIVVSNLLQTSSSLGPRRTSRGDARRGNPLGQKIPGSCANRSELSADSKLRFSHTAGPGLTMWPWPLRTRDWSHLVPDKFVKALWRDKIQSYVWMNNTWAAVHSTNSKT